MCALIAVTDVLQEGSRYSVNLLEARDFGIKKGFVNGGSMGLIFFIMFASYALAFWYGTQLFLNEGYSPGDILVVSARLLGASIICRLQLHLELLCVFAFDTCSTTNCVLVGVLRCDDWRFLDR